MKFLNRLCVCVVWMSSCFAVVTLAESISSTASSIASTNTAMSSTQPSTSSTNDSSTTSQAPVSLQSNSTGNESNSNSTNTSSTTQPSTSLSTTMQPTLCKNGTCSGNDSSCLNDTITETCTLTGSDCYQIVFINETDTYYEVGCMASCEYLNEDATGGVTKTTRCCNTNLCNNELLSDPDPESSAIQTSMSCITVILLLIANRVLT